MWQRERSIKKWNGKAPLVLLPLRRDHFWSESAAWGYHGAVSPARLVGAQLPWAALHQRSGLETKPCTSLNGGNKVFCGTLLGLLGFLVLWYVICTYLFVFYLHKTSYSRMSKFLWRKIAREETSREVRTRRCQGSRVLSAMLWPAPAAHQLA